MAYYAFFITKLSSASLPYSRKKSELLKGIMGSALYLVTTGIAFIYRPLALVIFAAVPLMYVVPALFMTDKDEA